jgi:hypothetical protein
MLSSQGHSLKTWTLSIHDMKRKRLIASVLAIVAGRAIPVSFGEEFSEHLVDYQITFYHKR